jgi:nucleoid DNA-binding protein
MSGTATSNKKIYQKLAEEFRLPYEEIRKICESQFEFTKNTIQSGEDAQVRLQYLGLFQVKPGRRDTVRKRRDHIKKYRK